LTNTWRSHAILQEPEQAIQRALWKAVGYTDDDLKRPLIGIANTWSELSPGHAHLRSVADAVKAGVWQAGGTPFEWNDFAQCPTITAGRYGIKYDTPTRDIVCASVEACIELHSLDGVVMISSCDKNVPAHLLAAARLNIPCIIVPGGPMLLGKYRGKGIATNELDIAAWKAQLKMEEVPYEELIEMENYVCPGPGACALLGTANTMQCLSEAVGMSLPGSATAPAVSAKRLWIAKESGKRIVDLVRKGITSSRIMTKEALENMIRVLHAIGGSSNAVLHILAIARELGVDDQINIDLIDKLSKETPCILAVRPNGPYSMSDFDEAGGVPGVMSRLANKLHLDVLTVTGKTLRENLQNVQIRNDEIIRPLSRPVFEEGLAVLRGNLATSAIVRPTVVPKNMLTFKGPAAVFNSQEDALRALADREIKPGTAIVVRYEGPRGGPGTSETFKVLGFLCALNLETSCAFITDGKISGFARGLYVCQVCPEAAVGGPIAIVQDGDIIEIDIPRRKINLKISESEIKRRLSEWKPIEPKVRKGFLTIYARLAEPADKGGGLPTRL